MSTWTSRLYAAIPCGSSTISKPPPSSPMNTHRHPPPSQTAAQQVGAPQGLPLREIPPGIPPQPSERFLRPAYRHGLSLYDVSYTHFSHQPTDITEALTLFDQTLTEVAAGG